MKPDTPTDARPARPTPEPRADTDPRLAAAVQAAFEAPCPEVLTGHILAAVRDEERAVRAWQAPWLFALPVIELALLVFLRSEAASLLGLAARLWSTIRDAAVPSWQGGVEAARFWWLAAGAWWRSGLTLRQDLLPWIAAALLAAAISGALILRQERNHV